MSATRPLRPVLALVLGVLVLLQGTSVQAAGHPPTRGSARPVGPDQPVTASGLPAPLATAGRGQVRVDPDPGPQVSDAAAGIISTFAGGSADGGGALKSTFKQPYDALVAPDGSIVVVDTYDNRLRRIDPATGTVSTVAGTGEAGVGGDGMPATQGSLNFPMSAAYGPDGSLYIADAWNDRIRKVDPAGEMSTVAGEGPNDALDGICYTGDGIPATSARLCQAHGVAVAAGGDLFIADTGNDRIRRVDAETGTITTVAGNGLAGIPHDGGDPTTDYVNHPWGIMLDPLGNPVFSTDDYRIRYVNLLGHAVTLYPKAPSPLTVAPNTIATIAGGNGYALDGTEGDGGPATAAALTYIKSLHRTPGGDLLLPEDGAAWDGTAYHYAMRIRRISWRTGIIRTVAGNSRWGKGPDGVRATRSALSYPQAAFVLPDHGLVIVDRGNSRLRVVDHITGIVDTIAGHDLGDGLQAPFGRIDLPWGVAAGASGVYLTDERDLRVRRVAPGGTIRTAVGSGRPCVLFGVAFDGLCESQSGDGGPAPRAHISTPAGMDLSADGLLAMSMSGAIRVVNETGHTVMLYPDNPNPITLKPGHLDVVAGGGDTALAFGTPVDARSARLNITRDVAWADNGDLLIAETTGCRINRIDGRTGQISVVAGAACNQFENYLDGPAASARFLSPFSVAEGPDGNVYVADTGNQVIREIDAVTGVVSTIAGTPLTAGFSGDGGPAGQAEFAYPASVSFAPDGSIVVADSLNDRIRRIAPDTQRTVTTLAGSGPSYANSACGSSVPCGHYAGDGGLATAALLNIPLDAMVTPDGLLLISDQYNDRIRAVQTTLRS